MEWKIGHHCHRMSELPQSQAVNNAKISSGDHPHSPEHGKFLVPSPLPTRRNRTYSQSEKALKGETHKGNVKEFCRSKGHGFITSEDGKTNFFVHISDVEGEYVPKPGDDVTFKLIKIPPNFQKQQAVHVQITHLAPGVSHETWNSPNASPNMSPRT